MDAALAWRDDICQGDLDIADLDLRHEEGLRSAVLISLFTDRQVGPEELPAGESDRRGWWGDGLSDDDDKIGSRIVALDARKAPRRRRCAGGGLLRRGIGVATGRRDCDVCQCRGGVVSARSPCDFR